MGKLSFLFFCYCFLHLFYLTLIRCNLVHYFIAFRRHHLKIDLCKQQDWLSNWPICFFRQPPWYNTIIILLNTSFWYFHIFIIMKLSSDVCCCFSFAAYALLRDFNHKMHEWSTTISQKLKALFHPTHGTSCEYRLLSGLLQLLHVRYRCRFTVAQLDLGKDPINDKQHDHSWYAAMRWGRRSCIDDSLRLVAPALCFQAVLCL